MTGYLTNYAKAKLAILEEFEICLTIEEENKLRKLINEISIDNFFRTIFDKYL